MPEPRTIALIEQNFRAHQSTVKSMTLDGESVLNVLKDPKVIPVDEPTYARLLDETFHNGMIEVKLLSRLLPDAPDFARGFIGITFRINPEDNAFEGVYIRPTNGRAEDQLRRNRSTQYFSYPDHKFDDFRASDPGKYESYADMDLDEWIDFKLVVEDTRARLYLNGSSQPVLIVNDLKHGPSARGAIGLWTEIGTDAFFKDLKITHFD